MSLLSQKLIMELAGIQVRIKVETVFSRFNTSPNYYIEHFQIAHG